MDQRLDILLVDDHPLTGKLLRKMLAEKEEFHLHAVTDPREAEAAAKGIQPAVMLLDLNMPDIDGLTLLKRFRSRPETADTPIIILTANEDPLVKADAFRIGADDYLIKLPEAVEMVARLHRHGLAGLNHLRRLKAEKALRQSRDELETRVRERTAALEASNQLLATKRREMEELNALLERRVREEVENNRRKDFMLMHQSRLAAMGEMIGAIAHQWRQPINALGLLLANLQDAHQYGELTESLMNEQTGKGRKIIDAMSATIDDFRNFFQPSKRERSFDLEPTIRDALTIMQDSLHKAGIDVTLSFPEETPKSFGFSNEFSQVVLLIVGNAQDAIRTSRGVAGGEIFLTVERADATHWSIAIRDTGGGIPEEVLPRIFDPYFTTKEKGKGTGIGLFMVKLIVEEHVGGAIEAVNVAGGAEFRMTIPEAGIKDRRPPSRKEAHAAWTSARRDDEVPPPSSSTT